MLLIVGVGAAARLVIKATLTSQMDAKVYHLLYSTLSLSLSPVLSRSNFSSYIIFLYTYI